MTINQPLPNSAYKKLPSWLTILFLMLILMSSCTPVSPSTVLIPTITPAATASLAGIGSTKVSAKDNATMVHIPAGTFIMGSEKGLADEQPAHTVELDAFWLDRTEVTHDMYRKCVEAGKCKQPGVLTYYNDPHYLAHPVVHVSWADSVAYCSFADRRLPTEAEWEKAASWDPQTHEKLVYPWGNEYDCPKGNFDDETKLDASLMQLGIVDCDGYALTAPVGSFPAGASPYGALDMGGNVWEWVHDAFIEVDPLNPTIENYYANSPASNPMGVDPSITEYRVMRGGSWNWTFGFGRAAYRLWYGKDDKYDAVGFRCALSE